MAERVEREFKLRIPSEAAFRALLARLGGPVAPPIVQVNHFFDTAARTLRLARIALRLRCEPSRDGDGEEGVFTLGLKGPLLASQGALAARPEEELVLAAPVARALLSGARSPLEELRASALAESGLVRRTLEIVGPEPLRLLGAFENERTRVGPLPFPPGSSGPPLVFELDRTSFPGGRLERELEVELPAGADPAGVERALFALLSGLGFPAEAVPSKAARFFGLLDGRGA